MSLTHEAVRGAKWTSSGTLLTAMVHLVQFSVLANLLTPVEFGLMAMLLVVIGFAQAFADLGMSAAIIHRQEVSLRQLSTLYWLNIGGGLLLYGSVVLAAPLVTGLFSEPALRPLIPAAAAVLLLSPFGIQFQVLFQKELRFDLLAKVDVSAALAGAALAIGLAVIGFGVWALIWGTLLQTFLKNLLVVIPGWEMWKPRLHFAWNDARGFVSFGLYQMGERVINFFNSRADQLLIGALLGARALGYYNLAFNLVLQPTMRLNPIITRVAFPIFSRLQNDTPRLRRGYVRIIGLLTVVNAPILFGLAAVAPLVVPLLFGEQWTEAVPLLQVLCFYALIRSTGNPIGSLLLAKGRADIGFRWNLALLVVVAPVIYLAASYGGLIGVAYGLVTLQSALAVGNYWFLVRPMVGSCLREYASAIAKPVAAAALMGATVMLLPSLADFRSPFMLTGALVLSGAILYSGLLWIFDRPMVVEVRTLIAARP